MYNYYAEANVDNGSCFSLTSFELNPLNYQFNMSVTAQIEESPGVYSTNSNDSIVFISSITNEVSGFATLELIPNGTNSYYAFITAYSNSLSDNLNVYILTDASSGNSDIVDVIEFIPNSILGSISNPWIFSLDNSGGGNFGCTNPAAINYSVSANINDGSCVILGCTNPNYTEYNVSANEDDGSCEITWQEAYLSQVSQNSINQDNLSSVIDSLTQANLLIQNLQDSVIVLLSLNDMDSQSIIDSLQQEITSLENGSGAGALLEDYYIEFPLGWSFFGYNCFESIDLESAFAEVSDKIIILKDENGDSYLPEWNYNGIGDLNYTEGYQVKTNEQIIDFQFCKILIPE